MSLFAQKRKRASSGPGMAPKKTSTSAQTFEPIVPTYEFRRLLLQNKALVEEHSRLKQEVRQLNRRKLGKDGQEVFRDSRQLFEQSLVTVEVLKEKYRELMLGMSNSSAAIDTFVDQLHRYFQPDSLQESFGIDLSPSPLNRTFVLTKGTVGNDGRNVGTREDEATGEDEEEAARISSSPERAFAVVDSPLQGNTFSFFEAEDELEPDSGLLHLPQNKCCLEKENIPPPNGSPYEPTRKALNPSQVPSSLIKPIKTVIRRNSWRLAFEPLRSAPIAPSKGTSKPPVNGPSVYDFEAYSDLSEESKLDIEKTKKPKTLLKPRGKLSNKSNLF